MSLFAHYYTYVFTNSESISSVPMEDSEWQHISLLNTDIPSLEERGTWQKTKQTNLCLHGDYIFKGENR